MRFRGSALSSRDIGADTFEADVFISNAASIREATKRTRTRRQSGSAMADANLKKQNWAPPIVQIGPEIAARIYPEVCEMGVKNVENRKTVYAHWRRGCLSWLRYFVQPAAWFSLGMRAAATIEASVLSGLAERWRRRLRRYGQVAQ